MNIFAAQGVRERSVYEQSTSESYEQNDFDEFLDPEGGSQKATLVVVVVVVVVVSA